jgi:hypothetical protein
MKSLTKSEGNFYDAFISYSTSEKYMARRIHSFLQSYRYKVDKRRVKVYLDHTDIRGGNLHHEIRIAISNSEKLIVVLSPAAIESRWITQEVEFFTQMHGHAKIAHVLMKGESLPKLAIPANAEYRYHDIRKGWKCIMWTPKARLELLRLLAFVTDVDLRMLRNWHRRKRLRAALINICIAFVLFCAIAFYPIENWEPLSLNVHKQSIYAISAQVEKDKLVVASRFQGSGPQGFRNYIRNSLHDISLDSSKLEISGVYIKEFPLYRRLFHVSSNKIPVDLHKHILSATNRKPEGEPFVAEPIAGNIIVVQPLGLTEDELNEAKDINADLHTPIPNARGSVIVTINNKKVHSSVILDLSPYWQNGDNMGPTSPAKALSVAWSKEGEIWLGVPGWDTQTSGGLWNSTDNGLTWARNKNFNNVSSVAIREKGGITRSIIVTESYFEQWRGILLEPYTARVVELLKGDSIWKNMPAPPFGSRSELEFCGELNGVMVMRVDRTVYLQKNTLLWKFLWK